MPKKFLSVSTKTGDSGQTSLANGERIAKSDPLFDVLGTVDELNSWLGLVVARFDHSFGDERALLLQVQDYLFYLGAELARSPKISFPDTALTELERHSEKLQQSMQAGWTTKFLLPGGTELGAEIDIARTVCRRAERELVRYNQAAADPTRPLLQKYLNRLSDYLFVLRCFINHSQEYPEQPFEPSFLEEMKK